MSVACACQSLALYESCPEITYGSLAHMPVAVSHGVPAASLRSTPATCPRCAQRLIDTLYEVGTRLTFIVLHGHRLFFVVRRLVPFAVAPELLAGKFSTPKSAHIVTGLLHAWHVFVFDCRLHIRIFYGRGGLLAEHIIECIEHRPGVFGDSNNAI